jgi:hypothetical protein
VRGIMEMMTNTKPTVHTIKCWTNGFMALVSGMKKFEWRKDDRNYQIGDHLLILEWDEVKQQYTSKYALRVISYKLAGGWFGMPQDYCILSLETFDDWFSKMKATGLDPMDGIQIRAMVALMS